MKGRRVPDNATERPPAAAPARGRGQGLAERGAAPLETSQPHPTSKQGREGTSRAAEQMVFRYRRTHAERIAAGELCDAGERARAAGFRWPLAVSAQLWRQVETVPPDGHPKETVADRWRHVLLLAAPAAAQIIRDGLRELKINVVLRTSAGPDRSKEHIKHLLLSRERTVERGETFALGYCAEV